MKHLFQKLILSGVTFFILGFMLTAKAQLSLFSYEKYLNAKGETLSYRQLFAASHLDTIHKIPLVIFLHGSGERGNDNEAQLKWGIKNFATDDHIKFHPSLLIVPQCPENLSWSNFTTNHNGNFQLAQNASKPMELLNALIHQIIAKYPIDTNRIYITGLSMGGFGTIDAIERYPSLFAAAVPVCGGGDISLVEKIKHIPIWIFHGAEDATVNPSNSLKMVEALSNVGGHPGLTLYPEVGHFSWIQAYSDPLMIEWLYRQHK